jgi:hypothetical protein
LSARQSARRDRQGSSPAKHRCGGESRDRGVLEKTNAALAAGRAKLARSSPAIKRAAEKPRGEASTSRLAESGRQEASSTVRRSRTATAADAGRPDAIPR